MTAEKDRLLRSGDGSEVRGKINWRDTFDVWPYLALTFKLLPWSWRLSFRWEWLPDGRDGYPGQFDFRFSLGPVQGEFGGNWPPFPTERASS